MPSLKTILQEKFAHRKGPLKRGEREAQSLKRRRQKDFLRRSLSVAAGAAAVLGGIYAWQSGRLAALIETTQTALHERVAEAGLVVEDIQVSGQQNTSVEEIARALDLRQGQSIVSVDLKAMRDRVEQLDWVRRAVIARVMPNGLSVTIEEYQPAALWQVDGNLWIVTEDGHRITDQHLAKFAHLPMVVGRGAEKHLGTYLARLAAHPDLAAHIETAVRVGQRRWDLHLKQGVTIRLPEQDEDRAWRRFQRYVEDHNILNRNILVVDFRQQDRTIVRLTPEEAERRRLAAQNEDEESI
tara:strand:- start:3593 stop:4486 length:894 start_codon:yes stop_codon:yes gene_type:complete